MSLRQRIRDELDKGTGADADRVIAVLVKQGLSEEELVEALSPYVRGVMLSRSPGAFFTKPVEADIKQTHTPSAKVAAFQKGRLDEMYPVRDGGYKRLSEMNRDDIKYAIEGLNEQIGNLQGRIDGWNKILAKLDEYKVNSVDELPDSVKRDI